MKAILFFGLVSLCCVVTALVYLNKRENLYPNSKSDVVQTLNSTDQLNCSPHFTHEFTEYEKIDAFQPIGSISGASRGRSYITVKKDQTVPVYAPMDASLISVI